MPKETALPNKWVGLRSGDRVVVTESDHVTYEATVDDLTTDARVVWVIPDSGDIRRAFDCREEISIRRVDDSF